MQSRYYNPTTGRFINADGYVNANGDLVGFNMYAYCGNNPIMYTDHSGEMPTWAKWVIGGVAVAGLIVATVLTCGVAGAGAAAVGTAMLAGGLVSAGINIADQIHDGGDFDWTELAISTLSGTAYGMVVGLTGGAAAGWSWAAYGGKLVVAGGTALLNSWNSWDNGNPTQSLKNTLTSLGSALITSTFCQGIGYATGQLITKLPGKPTPFMTTLAGLWDIPAIKTGVIRFVGGLVGSVINDYSEGE